jgi:arylsulfatase A-like enzyme
MRRPLIGFPGLLCLALVAALPASVAVAAAPPNIVLFYIDDLGWRDVGFMGSGYYQTPHVDRLAAEGMVFSAAYSCGPNCAPSRASLMSGQYTPRHGIYTVGTPARGQAKLRKLIPTPNKTVLGERFVTIAEALQEGGYVTATMGKWHLGPDPTTQGFDINIAGREWGSPSGGGYHSPYRYPNCEQSQPGEYLTDRLGAEAVKFIEQQSDGKPFFLYLTHYAVHTPIQAKADLTAKYEQKTPTAEHDNPKYAAMIDSMDQSIGAVLQALERKGLTQNTVVLFTSDNGGHGAVTKMTPLRGSKGMLYEGGIRVPMCVRWPGVVEPGTKCDVPAIGVDLYPTLLEIAGIDAPAGTTLDGESLLPLLKQTGSLQREAIYWHFPAYLQGYTERHGAFRTTPAGAIRQGDFKLIEFFEDGTLELYNLADDIGETENLTAAMPEKTAQLHERMKAWRSEVAAPVPTEPNPKYDSALPR